MKLQFDKTIYKKEFEFIFGDFNNLLEISRKELQPLLYDYENFSKHRDKILEKDQMKKVFSQVKCLKNFKEAEISKNNKNSCPHTNSKRASQITSSASPRNSHHTQTE